MTMDMIINDHIRCQSTNADAGYGFQGVFKIRASFALIYPQALSNQFQYRLSSSHVAGCPPADSDDFSAPWLSVKLSIKTDHALYLTRRKPQTSGYERYRLRRDISELTLDFLQQRYHRPLLLTIVGNDGIYAC